MRRATAGSALRARFSGRLYRLFCFDRLFSRVSLPIRLLMFARLPILMLLPMLMSPVLMIVLPPP